MLAVPSLVWAKPGEVTLSLEMNQRPEMPGWVCVVSEGEGKIQVRTTQLDGGATDKKKKEEANRVEKSGVKLKPFESPEPESPEPESSEPESSEPESSEPVELSTPSAGSRSPERCPSYCDPRPPDESYYAITCRANSRVDISRKEVLLLEVAAGDKAPVSINSLDVDGSRVVIGTSLKGDSAKKLISVVGGHYQAAGAATEVRGDRRGTLVLEPLCREIPFNVPRIIPPAGERTERVRVDTGDGSGLQTLCKDFTKGSIYDPPLLVKVPFSDDTDKRKKVEVTVDQVVGVQKPAEGQSKGEVSVIRSSAGKDDHGKNLDIVYDTNDTSCHDGECAYDVSLSAKWQGAWPTPSTTLLPDDVTFFWPRDKCLYPYLEGEHDDGRVRAASDETNVAGDGEVSDEPNAMPDTSNRVSPDPLQQCPEARLAGAEQACRSPIPHRDGCYYRCPADGLELGAGSRALSVSLTFVDGNRGQPSPEWSGKVSKLNQRFNRSIPESERRVRVDLSNWTRDHRAIRLEKRADRRRTHHPKWSKRLRSRATKVDGRVARPSQSTPAGPEVTDEGRRLRAVAATTSDPIKALVLRRMDGTEHRIKLESLTDVQSYVYLPEAGTCHDGQTVQIDIERELNEDRRYNSQSVEIQGDTIKPEHPMASARVLYFGTGVSIGAVYSAVPGIARQQNAWSPALMADLSLRFRFKGQGARPWRFELPRLSYLLSTQPYQRLVEPGEGSRLEKVGYSRILFGPAVRFPVTPGAIKFSGSIGTSLSVGRPLRTADSAIGRYQIGWAHMAEASIRIRPRVEFRANVRFIHFERLQQYSTELRGHARRDEIDMHRIFLGLGIAATW